MTATKQGNKIKLQVTIDPEIYDWFVRDIPNMVPESTWINNKLKRIMNN